MKPACVVWLGFFALSSAAFAAAPIELKLANPGFEQAPRANDPVPGWTLAQHAGEPAYEMRVDNQVHAQGRASFSIERMSEQVYGAVLQRVPLTQFAGKTIELSALMRTQEVGPGGWVLTLTLRATPDEFVQSAPMTGTKPFTRVSVKTKVPADAHEAEIIATLQDAGKAWLDDVRLRVLP